MAGQSERYKENTGIQSATLTRKNTSSKILDVLSALFWISACSGAVVALAYLAAERADCERRGGIFTEGECAERATTPCP